MVPNGVMVAVEWWPFTLSVHTGDQTLQNTSFR